MVCYLFSKTDQIFMFMIFHRSGSIRTMSVAPVTKACPRDSKVILSMLKDLGLSNFEPRVLHQLLEYSYRYVISILEDAKAYANHAGRETIDLEDAELAVKTQIHKVFCSPLPRDFLLEFARSKNDAPLPIVEESNQIRMPPYQFCFITPSKGPPIPPRKVPPSNGK